MATRTVLTTTQVLDASSYVDYRVPGGMPPVVMSGDVFPELILNPRPTVNADGYKVFGGSCTLGLNPGGGLLITKRSATTAGVCSYFTPIQNKRHEINIKVRTSSVIPVKVTIGLRIFTKATATTNPTRFKEIFSTLEVGQTAKTLKISWDGKWTGIFDSSYVLVNGPASKINLIIDECSVLLPVQDYQPTIGVPHLNILGNSVTYNELPITLSGVNIVSYYDTGVTESIYNHKTVDYRIVFKDIADMGMNVVRWCTWYAFFESDAAPGVWIEDGFDYLKSIITRARNNGIILIIDMHHPQGGCQSPSYSGGFWSNTAQQTRLKNLWVEIARRFKDEPYLIFDLINEPNAGANTAQMTSYFGSVVSAIREVDPNHLIIVEPNYGTNEMCGLINDSKIIYDTHSYPNVYANQYSYQQCSNFMGSYPSTKPIVPWTIGKLSNTLGQTSVAASSVVGWSEISYTLDLPTDPNGLGPNFIRPIVSTTNTAGVLVDKIQVYEDNNVLMELQLEVKPSNVWDPIVWKPSNNLGYNFAQTSPMISLTYRWSGVAITTGATGTKANYSISPLNGKSCINLVATSGEYGITCPDITIPIDKTKSYRVVVTVKPVTANSLLSDIKVGASVYSAKYEEDLAPMDATSLPKFLDLYTNYPDKPLNIGEIGWNSLTFINDGGEILLGDALDYMLSNNINFQWFAYGESKYGIFYGIFAEYPTEGRLVNQKAINMFKTKLLKP